MFAMCSATDTYDIALAAEGLIFAPKCPFDGDATQTPIAKANLIFSKTLAFENFQVLRDPLIMSTRRSTTVR
jgi:hypothetical protein